MTGPDPTRQPTVTVDVTTTAGDFTVRASFTAGRGTTALFGPSGAGKSLTLATIAGLLRPSEGTITIGGTVVADARTRTHVRTQDRKVGMAFQHAALLPHRSPLDNVALSVHDSPRRRRRARALDLLEQVHAGHLADAATSGLSGGERQRVALARAIASDPDVLLLDEPFSALDRPTRTALRALVADLVTAHDLTALLVTHDLDDIAHLADHVILYDTGQTVRTQSLDGVATGDIPRILGLLDPT